MAEPQDCRTMADLRVMIDDLDRDLVALLARRQACIDRAVEIKRGEGLPALVPDRVADVLEKVASEAAERGLDTGLATDLWRRLIDWSVAYEARRLPHETGDE